MNICSECNHKFSTKDRFKSSGYLTCPECNSKYKPKETIYKFLYTFIMFYTTPKLLTPIRFNNIIDYILYMVVLFVDGTKIEANANKYTFVWRKSIEKNQARLYEKISKLILNINHELHSNYLIVDRNYNVEYLNEILIFLNQKKVELNIEFLYGKCKRKSQIQRDIELLEEIISILF